MPARVSRETSGWSNKLGFTFSQSSIKFLLLCWGISVMVSVTMPHFLSHVLLGQRWHLIERHPVNCLNSYLSFLICNFYKWLIQWDFSLGIQDSYINSQGKVAIRNLCQKDILKDPWKRIRAKRLGKTSHVQVKVLREEELKTQTHGS